MGWIWGCFTLRMRVTVVVTPRMSTDDGQGAALWVCDGGVSVAWDGEEAGGGRGVSGCWGRGNFPSHRALCEFRRRHLEDFKGYSWRWCVWRVRWGLRALEAVDRRDEGACEREQAQGDELRADGGGGAAFGGADRSAPEAGARLPMRRRTRALASRCAGMSCRRSCAGARTGWRRLLRRRSAWRHRNARRTTRAGAHRAKTATPRAGGRTSALTGARRQGAEQLHRPRQCHH